MKKHFVITVLALFGVVACDRSKDSTSPAVQREKTLHALAIKNNAVEDWEKPFTNKTSVFTIDLQDAVLNKSTPFEFAGTLDDVRREGEHIVAVLSVSATASLSISLQLICTDYQRKILASPAANYAIIATIQKVMKQGNLIVTSAATRDENGEFHEATFDVNWDTDTYWLTGTCLDLQKLSD